MDNLSTKPGTDIPRAQPNLAGLPAELRSQIYSHCSLDVLRNFRLVSKLLEEEVTPLVFEHVYLALFQHCLDNFCSLSKSRLAKHVKRVTFYADVLPRWNRQRWEDAIDFRYEQVLYAKAKPDKPLPSSTATAMAAYLAGDEDQYQNLSKHEFSSGTLDKAYQHFYLLRDQQSRWLNDSSRLLFKEAFAMLPNVVWAYVESNRPFERRNNGNPFWWKFRTKTLVGPDDWWSDKDLLEYYDEEMRAEISGQAFLCLLEAIGFRASFASTTKHVTLLTWVESYNNCLRKLDSHRFGSTDYVLSRWAGRWQHIVEGFRHVTELILRVPKVNDSFRRPEFPDDSDDNPSSIREVVQLLNSAPKLQKLNLVVEVWADHPSSVQLSGLFVQVPIGLTHLWLSSCGSSILGLRPLLQRLASTLRALKLGDILLSTMEFDGLLLDIPNDLNLEEVHLVFLKIPCSKSPCSDEGFHELFHKGIDIDEPYERGVKAYLLGEGRELPARPPLPCELGPDDVARLTIDG